MVSTDKATRAELLRDDPAAISAYLTEIFKENKIGPIRDGLSAVMQAQNVQMLARDAGLRRDTLYRTFGGRTDPQLSRVLKLFKALNVRAGISSTSGGDGSELVAARLCQAFATNNPADAIQGLSSVVKAQNVTALALSLGIQRTTVYKTFGGSVDPQLGRVLNLFSTLQLRFAVEALPTLARPPRPILGRPRKVHS